MTISRLLAIILLVNILSLSYAKAESNSVLAAEAPVSGEKIVSIFNEILGGFNDFNQWLDGKIGFNIYKAVELVGQWLTWSLTSLIKLVKLGLSYL